jgi:hypothetical protein
MNVRRPLLSRRVIAHSLGIVVAALILWLAWQGYRQPELLIDFANARLC